MNEGEARRRFAAERVGRLATVRANGTPHVVPFVFAVEHHAGSGERLYWAVDHKAKSSDRITRLDNIAANPSVEAVADHYEDDWRGLWWVRATGAAAVVTDDKERAHGLELLAAKYPQYREAVPAGDVVRIDVEAWSWWEWRHEPGGP
jgi:PPOX class probable F420-dependent enzyme